MGMRQLWDSLTLDRNTDEKYWLLHSTSPTKSISGISMAGLA